jgi:hypothetical protein
MTKPYIGGCACGAIRYETSSKPIVESHCQCRDCQKRSGTGHGSYLVFSRRTEVSIAGEAKNWRVAGDSGNEKDHAFCPTCGTPVYLTFVAMPELIAVHATSLDDPSQFNPQLVTYGIRPCLGRDGFLAADIRANAAWLSVEDAIKDTTVIHPRYAARLAPQHWLDGSSLLVSERTHPELTPGSVMPALLTLRP